MAFLDFLKNRAQQQQANLDPSQQPKPESAKEMYTREAAIEKASAKPVEQISAADKAAAREAGERIEKATQHLNKNAPTQPSAPADGTGSPEPLRQNMTGQEKTQESLSPTDTASGKSPSQEKQPAPEAEGKRTEQTMPRLPPSWER